MNWLERGMGQGMECGLRLVHAEPQGFRRISVVFGALTSVILRMGVSAWQFERALRRTTGVINDFARLLVPRSWLEEGMSYGLSYGLWLLSEQEPGDGGHCPPFKAAVGLQ